MKRSLARALCQFSLALMLTLLPAVASPESKASETLKPEELVAKHLDALGTAEARAAVRSRTIVGTCRVTFRGRGAGTTEGVAVLASEGDRNLIGMRFATTDYPHEKMGYDGKNFTVSYLKPGVRSTLGDFLLQHEAVFKHGLVGGTLSSGWPLLTASASEMKLESGGLKKIDGQQLHAVRYLPRKGSELKITLFFDAKTFRHVRTLYERVVAANIGTSVDNSSDQRETRYQMVEEFSDFRPEGGLDLPHTYNLRLSIDAPNGTVIFNWAMNLQKFHFNHPIDINDFRVNSY
jgi:hypothetical protein